MLYLAASKETTIPAALFSLLDHTILKPENAVCHARANPLRITLDSSDFSVGCRGDLVCLSMVFARFFGAFSFHGCLFSRSGSSGAGRSESDRSGSRWHGQRHCGTG